MKMDWTKYIGHTLNIVLHENYGLTSDPVNDTPLYEIVFKTGKLAETFDDGLLLETTRENHLIKIYVPYTSIKCVEIFKL
jgi:hypothetical protein